MQGEFLTTRELANRWNLKYKTVSNWRCTGYGPKYHRMGTRINYRLEDVERYELSKRCRSTSEYPLKALQEAAASKQEATLAKQSLEQVTPLLKKRI